MLNHYISEVVWLSRLRILRPALWIDLNSNCFYHFYSLLKLLMWCLLLDSFNQCRRVGRKITLMTFSKQSLPFKLRTLSMVDNWWWFCDVPGQRSSLMAEFGTISQTFKWSTTSLIGVLSVDRIDKRPQLWVPSPIGSFNLLTDVEALSMIDQRIPMVAPLKKVHIKNKPFVEGINWTLMKHASIKFEVAENDNALARFWLCILPNYILDSKNGAFFLNVLFHSFEYLYAFVINGLEYWGGISFSFGQHLWSASWFPSQAWLQTDQLD